MTHPIPVLSLEYEHPEIAAIARPRRITRISTIAACAACAIAWLLIAAVTVESVIVTGPIIVALGIMIFVRGLIERRAAFTVLGAAHVGICLLFVVLVNLLRWSPNEATMPFTVMGAIYTVANGAASAWILMPSRWRQIARI